MTASFQTLVLPGKMTRIEVRQSFQCEQEQDRYENGHSWAGGLGMATGLEFREDQFRSVGAAKDWLEGLAEDQGDALAVRAVDHQPLLWDGTPNPACGVEFWVIGANCAC